MAELVDAPASGAGGGNPVKVQVLFSAPFLFFYPNQTLIEVVFFFALPLTLKKNLIIKT